MSRGEISKCRRHLHGLLEKISKHAFYCAYPDDLIQGVASEVYRRCGKEGCKCMDDDNKRHGPYLVVQLYENKKQRQVAIKKDEKHLWQLVRNYQLQVDSLLELKKSCTQLCNEVDAIIKMRLKKLEK